LLVGARLDREATVGYESFVRPDGDEPMQRLLFLRNLRSAASLDATAGATGSTSLAALAGATLR
jgi:hypothetical protein